MEIAMEGVCAGYKRRQRVLHDVDWTVRPGVTGLLGPNGAGKTTLLTVLTGLRPSSHGSVTVFDGAEWVPVGSGGRRGENRQVRGRFGYVPQRWSAPGRMRAVEVVEYAAWVNGVPWSECETAARRAVESVGLTSQARERVKALSGGQRQRLGIAAGLAHDPMMLVLDEPTVGLDPEQRWRVRDMISEIGRTRTVVLSSHLLDEVAQLCQRVGVLAEGRMVFDGTIADLELLATGDTTTDVDGGVIGVGDSSGVGIGGGLRSPIERGYAQLLKSAGVGE